MTRMSSAAALLALACCSRQPAGQPAATPRPAPAPASAIPAAMQGRFALAPAACDPRQRADPRGLLTIGGEGIAFGITPLTVDRVIIRPGRIAFDTTDTAAGASESRRYAFAVSPDHQRLTRTGIGGDLVYTRCPDQPSGTP